MVKYCAVAAFRNGTHIIDRTSRILLFLRTTLGETFESGSCSVNELTKSSKALSIRGSLP